MGVCKNYIFVMALIFRMFPSKGGDGQNLRLFCLHVVGMPPWNFHLDFNLHILI